MVYYAHFREVVYLNIGAHVEIIDNSDEILERFRGAVLRALERCGQQAEGYAMDKCPEKTGNLKNSITHKVDPAEKTAYVGTDVEYGPYVELGTGRYYEGGRQDPWKYQGDEGNWHTASGQEAQPFLKPAVADHKRTYRNIIRDEMENA